MGSYLTCLHCGEPIALVKYTDEQAAEENRNREKEQHAVLREYREGETSINLLRKQGVPNATTIPASEWIGTHPNVFGSNVQSQQPDLKRDDTKYSEVEQDGHGFGHKVVKTVCMSCRATGLKYQSLPASEINTCPDCGGKGCHIVSE